MKWRGRFSAVSRHFAVLEHCHLLQVDFALAVDVLLYLYHQHYSLDVSHRSFAIAHTRCIYLTFYVFYLRICYRLLYRTQHRIYPCLTSLIDGYHVLSHRTRDLT